MKARGIPCRRGGQFEGYAMGDAFRKEGANYPGGIFVRGRKNSSQGGKGDREISTANRSFVKTHWTVSAQGKGNHPTKDPVSRREDEIRKSRRGLNDGLQKGVNAFLKQKRKVVPLPASGGEERIVLGQRERALFKPPGQYRRS